MHNPELILCFRDTQKHVQQEVQPDDPSSTHTSNFTTNVNFDVIYLLTNIRNRARTARKSSWALSWQCLHAFCKQLIGKYGEKVLTPTVEVTVSTCSEIECTYIIYFQDLHKHWHVKQQREKSRKSNKKCSLMNLDRLQECHRPTKGVWHQTQAL